MSSSTDSDQVAQRKANLEALKALGVEVYPGSFKIEAGVSVLVDDHGTAGSEALETAKLETRTAGRILSIRSFGKANFLVISDGQSKIQ